MLQFDFAAMPGLADRLLVVRLDRRDGGTEDKKLSEEIAVVRDSGLSWICYSLHYALDDDDDVPRGLNKRHPDWADLAVRVGRAIGRGEDAENAVRAAEEDKSRFNLENDSVGQALLEACKYEVVSGTNDRPASDGANASSTASTSGALLGNCTNRHDLARTSRGYGDGTTLQVHW